jgi:hypothetical protein
MNQIVDLAMKVLISVIYIGFLYLVIVKRHALAMWCLDLDRKVLAMQESPEYQEFLKKWPWGKKP